MNPKQAVLKMAERGITQPRIVAMLAERGTLTTQETISRISTGRIINPSFDLGQAIVDLASTMDPPPPASKINRTRISAP